MMLLVDNKRFGMKKGKTNSIYYKTSQKLPHIKFDIIVRGLIAIIYI